MVVDLISKHKLCRETTNMAKKTDKSGFAILKLHSATDNS